MQRPDGHGQTIGGRDGAGSLQHPRQLPKAGVLRLPIIEPAATLPPPVCEVAGCGYRVRLAERPLLPPIVELERAAIRALMPN